MKAKIKGCYTALVTPFRKEGKRSSHAINYDALDRLIDFQIENRVDGLVIAGCTGTASVLNNDEQVGLLKHVQKNFGDRTTIIAGDGSNSTREAIALAKRMENEAGVFTHLSISPYVNKPSDLGLVAHYTEIANNIQGELILYSVPGRTGGKGIMPETAEFLSSHSQIIGIKEASGDLNRIYETAHRTRNGDYFVISGDDGLTLEIIKLGGVGVISVASNIVPNLVSKMTHYALNGNHLAAVKLDKKLSPLYDALFPKSESGNASPNPVMAHYALDQLGFNVGIPRLPLIDGSSEEKVAMDKVLEDLELI